MGMGSPEATASVAKMRRESCGVNRTGVPSGWVLPAGADPEDDRGEDLAQLGTDDEETFPVGLGRGDLQERDDFTGAGQGVRGEAAVRELEELLDPHPGVAQHLDQRPPPEGLVL